MVRTLSVTMIALAVTVSVSAFAKHVTPHHADGPTTPSIMASDQTDDPG